MAPASSPTHLWHKRLLQLDPQCRRRGAGCRLHIKALLHQLRHKLLVLRVLQQLGCPHAAGGLQLVARLPHVMRSPHHLRVRGEVHLLLLLLLVCLRGLVLVLGATDLRAHRGLGG